LVTTLVEAQPQHRFDLPGPSIWPLMLALASAETFIVGIFTPWGFAVGAVLAFIALFGWFWSPTYSHNEKVKSRVKQAQEPEIPAHSQAMEESV
jgi:cytochrome c oxidase subunit I+III